MEKLNVLQMPKSRAGLSTSLKRESGKSDRSKVFDGAEIVAHNAEKRELVELIAKTVIALEDSGEFNFCEIADVVEQTIEQNQQKLFNRVE